MSALSFGSPVLAPILMTKDRPSLVKTILVNNSSVARSMVESASSGGCAWRPARFLAKPMIRLTKPWWGVMIRAKSGTFTRSS